MDLTLDEAETVEEALDNYIQNVVGTLSGEPTSVQKRAMETAQTIGGALRTSIERNRKVRR